MLSGQTDGCMEEGVSLSAQTSGDLKGFSRFSAAEYEGQCWGLMGTSFLLAVLGVLSTGGTLVSPVLCSTEGLKILWFNWNYCVQ